MIESLNVANFQCHERFRLDCDPHVTTIVGRSDSGKSAILRALRFVCFNKPNGLAFIKAGTKKAVVRLAVDGHVITRTRSETDNSYQLDKKYFAAFGSEVPSELADILNLGIVNVQSQHDSVFWFSDTPGQVSRNLNEIVDLSLIDRTLANLGAELWKARSAADVCGERLEEARLERKRLKWAKAADEELRQIEYTEIDLAEKRLRLSRLNDLAKGIREASEGADRLRAATKQGGLALSLAEAARQKLGEADLLQNLIAKITQTTKLLCEANQKVLLTEAAFKKATKGKACPVCNRPLA